MKIAYIKSAGDNKSFKVFKNLGLEVYELEDLESVDTKIEELILEKATTIVLTNEVANFSEDIIKKYSKMENPKIIITSNKNK